MDEKRRFAVVEDDETYRKIITEYLDKFCEEKKVKAEITVFDDAKNFEKNYDGGFDAIFMDIIFPESNGMSVIRRLRQKDKKVLVVFVTSMAKYALKGYEVGAFDFILKPINYVNFSMKLSRVVGALEQRKGKDFWINTKQGRIKISTEELKYVEVMKHKIIYHLVNKKVEVLGSMKAVCEALKDEPFALCNRCYLVNLNFVTGVNSQWVTLGEEELSVSHLKKADFMNALNRYVSGDL